MGDSTPPKGRGGRPKCGGTNRQGEPCGKGAGAGTDHPGVGNCKHHGGATPNGKKYASAQKAARIERSAERVLYQRGADPVENPLTALQALAGRALALEQAIGEIVNDLNGFRYESDGGGEQLRAEVVVLERAMDRAGRLLVDIAKLNIEERLAKVTEAQTALVADALAAVLGEMGLSPEQQRDAKARVGRRLRAV